MQSGSKSRIVEKPVVKQVVKIFGLALIFLTFNGCNDVGVNSKPTSNLTKFNGTWKLAGQTRVASPDEVSECGYGIGDGDLKISGTTIEGEFTDNSGFSYVLEGMIDESGKMSGAFTYVGYDAATFDGYLSVNEGKGTWKDIYDCPGTWQAKKMEGNLRPEIKDQS